MKRIFASVLLVTTINCKSDKPSSLIASTIEEPIKMELAMLENTIENRIRVIEPYELKVQMNKVENDIYDLTVLINLNNDAHFVSPNSKRDFKGKFTLVIDENKTIALMSDLIESPLSVEEIDPHPFVNGTINWVRTNTNYRQQLKRKVTTDFIVKGLIQFTIEPRCTLEKIPIIITYKSGKMTVQIDNC